MSKRTVGVAGDDVPAAAAAAATRWRTPPSPSHLSPGGRHQVFPRHAERNPRPGPCLYTTTPAAAGAMCPGAQATHHHGFYGGARRQALLGRAGVLDAWCRRRTDGQGDEGGGRVNPWRVRAVEPTTWTWARHAWTRGACDRSVAAGLWCQSVRRRRRRRSKAVSHASISSFLFFFPCSSPHIGASDLDRFLRLSVIASAFFLSLYCCVCILHLSTNILPCWAYFGPTL